MSRLEPPREAVKPRRPYDNSWRRERAASSRSRVIVAAEAAFLRDGYAGATIAAIGAEAGVSVDTIYKGFGGKPGLIRAIYTEALRGRETVPAEQRSEEVQATEPDPRAIIRAWGSFVAELTPRAAPLAVLVRGAALNHPELEALAMELDASRLSRMTDNARRLHAAGHLRAGVTIEAAADILWTYSSPELYELLVLRRGMSLEKYADFVAEAMSAALL